LALQLTLDNLQTNFIKHLKSKKMAKSKNIKTETKKSSKSQINRQEKPKFERVKPLLKIPLEITRDMLPGANMIDENIIVFDNNLSTIKQDAE